MTNSVTPLIFTPEEVRNLDAWQKGPVHPFTCGQCEGGVSLVPTVHGWICQFCDYRQGWAHPFMLDGKALAAMDAVVAELKAEAA